MNCNIKLKNFIDIPNKSSFSQTLTKKQTHPIKNADLKLKAINTDFLAKHIIP